MELLRFPNSNFSVTLFGLFWALIIIIEISKERAPKQAKRVKMELGNLSDSPLRPTGSPSHDLAVLHCSPSSLGGRIQRVTDVILQNVGGWCRDQFFILQKN